jgi:hypothetical protein
MYDLVLQRIHSDYSSREVVLYDAPLRIECRASECPERWDRRFSEEWMDQLVEREVIQRHCRYDRGLCVDGAGEPVVLERGIYLLVTTLLPCGPERPGCHQILTYLTMEIDEPRASVRRTLRFDLTPSGGGWEMEVTQFPDSRMRLGNDPPP